MDGIDDSFRYFKHFRHVAQESGSCSFSRHFLDRASEIDVYKIRVGLLYYQRSVPHGFGFPSVYLDSHRPLGIMYSKFACSGGDVSNECVCIDELCVNTIGTVAFAKHTKRRIGDILHRREIERVAL